MTKYYVQVVFLPLRATRRSIGKSRLAVAAQHNAQSLRTTKQSRDSQAEAGVAGWVEPFRILWAPQTCPSRRRKDLEHDAQSHMAAGAGDHLMLSRLGLGEDNAEKAGSSTLLLHENVVSFRRRRYPPISAPGARVCLLAAAGHRRLFSNRLARDTSAARWAVAMAHRPPACSARR